MTVSTTANRVVGIGNGATTVWNYSFIIPDATQAVVQLTDRTTGVVTTLTGAQYSITGIGNPLGGTVTYAPALTTNQTITIQRIVPLTQTVDLDNQGAFHPSVVEGSLDYLTMVTQQLNDALSRAFVGSPNGVLTVEMGGYRLVNLGAPVAANDSARMADVIAAQITTNQVPTPLLADVGKWLKATGVGAYAWNTISVLSSQISDATAAGIALLTGANAAAQRTSLGLGSLALLNTVTNTEVTANTLTFSKFARSGSVGQVWTSGGAGADPSYVGAMTRLGGGSVSGVATLDIAIPAGYSRYILMIDDAVPVTNNNGFAMRFSFDNGATYKSAAADYFYAMNYWNTSGVGGGFDSSTGTTSYINVGSSTTGLSNTAGLVNSYAIDIWAAAASKRPCVQFRTFNNGSGSTFQAHGAGGSIYNGPLTNVRLFFSVGGNISTATWTLYGVY